MLIRGEAQRLVPRMGVLGVISPAISQPLSKQRFREIRFLKSQLAFQSKKAFS